MITFMVKLRLNPGGAVYKTGLSICVGNEEKTVKNTLLPLCKSTHSKIETC